MRFLANENFPSAAVTALEAAGHEVVWARIAAPGMTDSDMPPAVPNPADYHTHRCAACDFTPVGVENNKVATEVARE
jgi:hypothetical protein